MTRALFLDLAIRPALRLLPPEMDTPAAQAFVLAIAGQESGCAVRRQAGKGPARSYWQFEKTGLQGVLTHAASRTEAKAICGLLDVRPTVTGCYLAVEYQDVLAAGLARLLLWTLPDRLPGPDDSAGAWAQYLALWRPGVPRPETWAEQYRLALEAVRE